MTTSQQQNGWAKLLDEAARLWNTDPQASISQLRVLSKTQFEHQPRAQQYLAVALFDIGQLDEAEAILDELLREYQEPTSFTRENRCYAAQICLTLGQDGQAQSHIQAAKQIAKISYDMVTLGRVRQFEGVVSASQGRADAALDEMISGRRMVEVHSGFQNATTGPRGPMARTFTTVPV